MQDLVLDLDDLKLTVGGEAVPGLVGAVASPGAAVMLLVDPAAILVRRERPGLEAVLGSDRVASPTDGHDRTGPYGLGTVPAACPVRH